MFYFLQNLSPSPKEKLSEVNTNTAYLSYIAFHIFNEWILAFHTVQRDRTEEKLREYNLREILYKYTFTCGLLFPQNAEANQRTMGYGCTLTNLSTHFDADGSIDSLKWTQQLP